MNKLQTSQDKQRARAIKLLFTAQFQDLVEIGYHPDWLLENPEFVDVTCCEGIGSSKALESNSFWVQWKKRKKEKQSNADLRAIKTHTRMHRLVG